MTINVYTFNTYVRKYTNNIYWQSTFKFGNLTAFPSLYEKRTFLKRLRPSISISYWLLGAQKLGWFGELFGSPNSNTYQGLVSIWDLMGWQVWAELCSAWGWEGVKDPWEPPLSVALPTSSWSCQGPPGAKRGLNLCDWTGKAHVLILDQANPYEDLALCLLKTQLSDCYHRYPPPHLHHHRRSVEINLLKAYHLQGAIVSTSHASWHFKLLVTPWSNIHVHAKSWSEQGSAHNKSSRKNN